MNVYLAFGLRVAAFLGLAVGFIGIVLTHPVPGRAATRVISVFVAGAYLAFFVEGPTWGTLDPVSARPLVVVLGVLLMGGPAWLLFISGAAAQ